MVEGLAVGPDGKVYSPTFNPTGSGLSQLFTFDPQGHLLKQVSITGSSPAMLGLAVIPGTINALLVIDFGASQVLMVDPTKDTNNAVPCITVPSVPTPPGHGLNALTFDAAGNVYISDSFAGAIWVYTPGKTASTYCSPSTPATPWLGPNDPTLLPSNGVPPFGANGVEFNNAGDTMFVCNTAMDWIVKIPTTGGKHGTPGTPVVFTNSLNGCDGLRLDSSDNIWVAANQADEIVVVSTTDPTSGQVIAKLGDFNGVQNGETQGLLFPASPAFSPDGKTLWVTNLELDLTTIGITQSVDSKWAAQVKTHSIAKLPVPATFPAF